MPPRTLKKKKSSHRKTKKRSVSKPRSITKIGSYSPTVNRHLGTINYDTPVKDIQMKYRMIKAGRKMYHWTNKPLHKILIKNMLSKKKINHKNVIGPKQLQANCWFNCFFTMFFISDKGRKFSKSMRKLMITGKKMNGQDIPAKMKWPMFLLNIFIDVALTGEKNTYSSETRNLNTNRLIKSIHKILRSDGHYAPAVEDAGNPLSYYKALTNYLYGYRKRDLRMISFIVEKKSFMANLPLFLRHTDNPPHIIMAEIYSDDAPHIKKPQSFTIGKYKYKLDSVGLIDNNGHHFSAYIHLNKKQYYFDGESNSPLVPFQWKPKLNKNVNWNTSDFKQTVFNFKVGYGCYIYYREK
tara:strand:- start:39 stop:1097 length:1059 start_codon:yes stop_codon:yes gene_type:complete